MMEYRKLPHGSEQLSVIGIGTGSLHNSDPQEIENVIREAIDSGVNFFDLCAGGASVYHAVGRAIRDCRSQVYFQLHFGAVYNPKGEYGWSRNLSVIQKTFAWELEQLHTDYVDFGMLHCVDDDEDLDELLEHGVFDYVRSLKKRGIVRHLGFSSHTPSVAQRLLDLGDFDIMLFSLNPAYDYERGNDELGVGTNRERSALLLRCLSEGVGVSVMKPFHGGRLLMAETSPFGCALTTNQCIRYALDRPAVLSVVPGVRNAEDLRALLAYTTAKTKKTDYRVIRDITPKEVAGSCVYCNHCLPCPAGIDIGLVNKYYDLALMGDKLARNHYDKLSVNATACTGCRHCELRCPFDVKQTARMHTIAEAFSDKAFGTGGKRPDEP